jgi:hypothetical protein
MDEGIESRVSKVAESFLENEALTSNLDDEAADLFLNWAIAKGEMIARSTIELDDILAEEAMYPRLKALRRIARYIGQCVIGSGDPGELVDKIIEQARLLYGEEFVEPDPVEKEKFVQFSTDMEQVMVVLGVKNLIEGEDDDTKKEI